MCLLWLVLQTWNEYVTYRCHVPVFLLNLLQTPKTKNDYQMSLSCGKTGPFPKAQVCDLGIGSLNVIMEISAKLLLMSSSSWKNIWIVSAAYCLWMFILMSLIGCVRLVLQCSSHGFCCFCLRTEGTCLVTLWDKYYPVKLIFRTERWTFRSLSDLALV